MSGKLQGKVAVITGASNGIGAQIAKRFAEEGARVVVNYSSSRQAGEKVAADIRSGGGEAIALQASVRDRGEIARLFAATREEFGTADILVNHAGVYEFVPLESIDETHFRELFDINVLGLIYATQEAVKQFDGRVGTVINISSVAGHTPAPVWSTARPRQRSKISRGSWLSN
jgi:3-oxoacyl-[acyl-carrier protein] reductase